MHLAIRKREAVGKILKTTNYPLSKCPEPPEFQH